MSRTLKHLLAILGFRPEAATMSTSRALRVYARVPDGERQHIGTLTVEDGEFVFRYTSEFHRKADDAADLVLPPIYGESIGPPTCGRSSRSGSRRWIAPTLLRALGRRKVDPSDVLSVLDTVARKTIANPYEVELAPAA